MTSQRQGFTLIELLVVIAIIGILSSTLVSVLNSSRKRAYDTAAINCAKSLQTAQAIAMVDIKTYLSVGDGTGRLNRSSDGVNQSCNSSYIFYSDRSDTNNLKQEFLIDVWDARGRTVYTASPRSIAGDQPGATPFSSAGNNLP